MKRIPLSIWPRFRRSFFQAFTLGQQAQREQHLCNRSLAHVIPAAPSFQDQTSTEQQIKKHHDRCEKDPLSQSVLAVDPIVRLRDQMSSLDDRITVLRADPPAKRLPIVMINPAAQR